MRRTTSDPQAESYPCPQCQAGMLRMEYLTFFTQVQGEMITVPNFPAWVCDMCGYREDDARAQNWLFVLLTPRTGRKRIRRLRRPQGPSGRDQART